MTTAPFKTTGSTDTAGGGSSALAPWGTAKWDHLRARLKVFAITYVALMAAGLAAVVLIPSVYRSQALVQVMTAEGMARELKSVDEPAYQKAVMSDDVLKAAAERLTGSAGRGGSGEYGTVRMLGQSVTVSVDSAKGWVQIAAESGNPQQAADLANAVAESYVELEKKHADESRKAFEPDALKAEELKKGAAEKEKALRQAETAMVGFDEESRSSLGKTDLAAARDELERKIGQARTDQAVAEAMAKSLAISEESLRKELEGTSEFLELPAVMIGPNPARTALLADIAREERELSDMLKRFTDKHPLVVEKRNVVEGKKSDLAKMEQKVSDTETRARQPNPIYLQVKQNYDQAKLKLQEANAKVAQQRESLKEAQTRLGTLDDRAKGRAALATDLARAKSEAEASGKELADCRERLERLERSIVVSRLGEAAKRPTIPERRGRGWWTAVVFATAVAGAMATTFGASVLDRTFESTWEVERALKLPVMGNISIIDEAQRRKRTRGARGLELITAGLLAAGLAAVALLSVFEAQIHGLRMFLFGN